MRILNVRLGHACNSSSSHSIVFLPGAKDDPAHRQEYGWDDFTLSTTESKLDYLSQQIYRVLQASMGDEVAYALAAGLTFVPPERDGYVDHQSVWSSFPSRWDSKDVDFEFLKDFRDYVLRDGVVILGGNDNSDGHPLKADAKELPLSYRALTSYQGASVARFDPDLNVWVLFNRSTGTKIRMSFHNATADTDVPHADLHKSFAPELVDVKVTDNCPYECAHCYQGSTKGAAHADYGFLLKLLDDLAEQRVFEVAYGGGEPTVHPDFLRLLRETKARRIVPNFTTRNIAFVTKHAKELKDYVGKVAVSVDFQDEIDKFKKVASKKDDNKNAFAVRKEPGWEHLVGIQHVVGSVPQESLVDLLKFCKENHVETTLLGWKTTGRGSEVQPHPVDWKAACKEAAVYRMSIDTALARSSDMSDIDPETYHTTEGSVSCYVDAVERKIGPSSYAASLLAKPYTRMSDDWKRVRVERGSQDA